jgi:O-antigen/teichoic acid export membrane protein
MIFRYLRNVFSNYALSAVTALVSFVLTPILYRYLHPANYAIFALGLATAAALEALDAGMLNALIRCVSILVASRSTAELNSLVSTVFFLLAAIGLFAGLVLAALSGWLVSFFHLTGPDPALVPLVLVLIGATTTFQLPGTALAGHLMGCQDFHLLNSVEIVGHIIRFGAILWVVEKGYGLLAIVAVIPAVALLRLVGMLTAARKAAVSFVPRWSARSLASLKAIWKFTSLSFIEDSATKWYLQLDSFLAARLLPLPDLAILNVARRFPIALTQLVAVPVGVAYPMVSSAVATGEKSIMERFMLVSTRLILAIELPLGSAMFIWAETILLLWVGPGMGSGVRAFQVLVVFGVAASLQEAPLTLLYGLGKIRLSTILSLAMLASAGLLAIPACARSGLMGLAIVYAATYVVGTLILHGQALRLAGVFSNWHGMTSVPHDHFGTRQEGISRWLWRSLIPPIVAELPALGWLVLSHASFPHTLAGLSGSVVPAFVLYYGVFQLMFRGGEAKTWKACLQRMLMDID